MKRKDLPTVYTEQGVVTGIPTPTCDRMEVSREKQHGVGGAALGLLGPLLPDFPLHPQNSVVWSPSLCLGGRVVDSEMHSSADDSVFVP